METQRKGDLTEAVVIAELKRRGIPVSVPFGDNERYDLVVESDRRLLRMQVKTGWYKDGTVRFKAFSVHTNSRENVHKSYEDEVEYFLVYCHELESMYLVPEDPVVSTMRLRVDDPDVVLPSINWASEFEFDARWPPEDDEFDMEGTAERTVRDLRERGVRVFEAGDEVPYDVLLERPSSGFARTSIRPGSVSEGRVRFDTGRTRAPGPEDVDLVLVTCEELDELYLIRRDEYDTSIGLRVEEPKQRHSSTNLATNYEFDERWPPDGS